MKAQFKTTSIRTAFNELVIESTMMLTDKLELSIYSKKGPSGTVYTQASVSRLENNGTKWISRIHTLFIDFSIKVQSEPCARVTAKRLKEFHDKIDFNSIVTQAREFYKLD